MKVMKTVGITEENYQALRKQADDFNLSFEDMVNQALRTYVKVSQTEPKNWPSELRLTVTQVTPEMWFVTGDWKLDGDRMLVVGPDFRFDDYYAYYWEGRDVEAASELLYGSINSGNLTFASDLVLNNITPEEAVFITQQIEASQWTK